MLINLFIFIFCTYGICFGFIQKCEVIYSKFSYLNSMADCEYCTGFWAGLISWILININTMKLSWAIIPIGISHAFAGAALCYIIDTILKRIESFDFGEE